MSIHIVSGKKGRSKEREDHYIDYQQDTVSDSAVGLSNIPPNANKAVIVVEEATIRWRADGTNPTSTVGTKAFVNATIPLSSKEQINNFKAIRQGSSDAKLSVNYYERK